MPTDHLALLAHLLHARSNLHPRLGVGLLNDRDLQRSARPDPARTGIRSSHTAGDALMAPTGRRKGLASGPSGQKPAAMDMVIRGQSSTERATAPPTWIEATGSWRSGGCRAGVDAVDQPTASLVTPGFVHLHTHFDGQATWNRRLPVEPARGHLGGDGTAGVGFVLGACRAPRLAHRPTRRGRGHPRNRAGEGMTWGWGVRSRSTCSKAAGARRRRPCAHAALLRTYVMGERGADHGRKRRPPRRCSAWPSWSPRRSPPERSASPPHARGSHDPRGLNIAPCTRGARSAGCRCCGPRGSCEPRCVRWRSRSLRRRAPR